jgi:hypothetical protein
MCCFVASYIRADFTHFEDVGVFWVSGTGDLECVPEDLVVVKEGVGCHDDAISQGSFFESPSDDVGASVR